MSKKKIVLTFIALMCMLCVSAQSVLAAQSSDPVCSLKIHCKFDNVVVSNAVFKLYLVGEGENNSFTYLSAFDDGNMPEYTDSISKETRQEIVDRLTSSVEKNRPAPLRIGMTDENGYYVFDSLDKGLYLVLSDETRQIGEDTYYPLPLLIHLPFTRDGAINNNPASDIKYDSYPPETTTETTTGTTTETTTPGDTTTTTPGDTTTTTPGDTTTTTPGDTTTTTPGGSTTTPPPGESTTAPPDKPPRIPKTGQLWWPVYALCAAGAVFVAFGVAGKRKSEDER